MPLPLIIGGLAAAAGLIILDIVNENVYYDQNKRGKGEWKCQKRSLP